MYKRQSSWVVPDRDLRDKICQQIVQAVVPVYRSYMQSYGPLVELDGSFQEANTNAKEEDETTCCFGFCRHNPDKEPQSFDPKDVYEQFEICKSKREKRFAVAGGEVAPDKRNAVDGVIWFRSSGDVGGEASVGLSLEIVGGIDEVGARKSNIEYFLCLACLDTTE
ncbi:hypothetical protein D5086_031430 [Populus alba]|uniref:Uncharacterized protein n=1 Tax=Populus alba TaxID=43335 RepID=A0ACC4AIN0_POPAL